MKIQSISYKRLYNLGDFNNETLDVTASIEDGEDAAKTAIELRLFVVSQIGVQDRIHEWEKRQIQLKQEIELLEGQCQRAQERWNKIEAFLQKLGVKLEQLNVVDDIPF
jgi:hypothetical protein